MTAINPMPPAVRQRRRYRREDILTTAIAAGSVNAANSILGRQNCDSLLHEVAGQAYGNGLLRQLLI